MENLMRSRKNWLGRGGMVLAVFMLATLFATAYLETVRVRVESTDGKRKSRLVSIGDNGRVYLVKQLSSAPCVEGRSWGYDRSKIWVDDGCRADFEVYRPDDWSDRNTDRFTLESVDGRRTTRKIDTRGGVKLVKQLSSEDCVRGKTWGYNRNQVWVDKGCRAVFEVDRSSGGRGSDIRDGYEDDRWLYIQLESNDGRRQTRWVDTGRAVSLFRKLSGRPCSFGKTWGFTQNSIWVDDGCRALFKIRKR